MQKIKSIISSGTQYIDTGIKPTGNTKVVFDFCAYDQTTAQQALFGARPGDTNRFTIFTGYSNSSFQADYNTYKTLADETVNYSWIDTTRRMVLEMSNALVVNGTAVATVDKISFTSTCSMYLFANNVAGTPQTYGKLRLYSCQIYDNGTLVRDYVPCLDDSGVVCLYDLVESRYYYNAGTGSFTAVGPHVFFRRRPKVAVAGPVSVTITGTSQGTGLTFAGSNSHCSIVINGTTYTATYGAFKSGETTAKTFSDIVVHAGDVISFKLKASSAGNATILTLNETTLINCNSGDYETYEWTVPANISTIEISAYFATTGGAYIKTS